MKLEILRPKLFLEQILNSLLSFILIREIITSSSISFLSHFNTLIVICYSLTTVSRLYLQNAISKGILDSKSALRDILKSNLIRILCGIACLIIATSLMEIRLDLSLALLISILLMDFIRYFYLFTNRVIPTMVGNAVAVFLAINLFIWFSDQHIHRDMAVMLWIALNLIYAAVTMILGASSKYRFPSDLFTDKTFGANFRLILLDSLIIQLFQTVYSLSLLHLFPEANAAARISAQIFLSIPNLLIASTAPLVALYVSKGSISYATRFKLMLVQLTFFLLPIILIFLPEMFLDSISGTSDRYYLKYQIGFLANGMSIFVISTFSYGHISLFGGKKFLAFKASLIFFTFLLPIVALEFFGVMIFNLIAILTLSFNILISKKYVSANS